MDPSALSFSNNGRTKESVFPVPVPIIREQLTTDIQHFETLCIYSIQECNGGQLTNDIHDLITVFTMKLVQVSYNMKPIIVSFERPLINKLHCAFNTRDINTNDTNFFFFFYFWQIFERLVNGPKPS